MTETMTAAEMKVIVFQLNEKEYAIPVSEVSAIEKVQHITRVPNVAKYVKGVINLRGVVTPIIDLRLRFDMPEIIYSESSRVIIVLLNDMEVGLVVDAANDVIDVSIEAIEPSPEIVGVTGAAYIKGVVKIDKRLLILLDLEKVLQSKQIMGHEGN